MSQKFLTKSYLQLIAVCILFLTSSSLSLAGTQGRWIHSEQLMPGMKLITQDNKIITVIEPFKTSPKAATTYNLEVANDHTYFVTDKKVWVHNTADCYKGWRAMLNRQRIVRSEMKAIKKGEAQPLYQHNPETGVFRETPVGGRVNGHIQKAGDDVEVTIFRYSSTDSFGLDISLQYSIEFRNFGQFNNLDIYVYRAALRNPAQFEAAIRAKLGNIIMPPGGGHYTYGVTNLVNESGDAMIRVSIHRGLTVQPGSPFRALE